jgi:transcriptional regulator with XRE-family HTH domain
VRTKNRAEIVWLFAERLREVRQSRGMTQVELARQADVSPTHLSVLENADLAPGISPRVSAFQTTNITKSRTAAIILSSV